MFYFQLFSVAVLTVFLWEHLCRVNQVEIARPSRLISWCAIQLETMWAVAGRFWALLSSFLYELYFRLALWDTFYALVEPLWRCLVAPYHFVQAYVALAQSYAHPWCIYLGSSLLVLVGGLKLLHWLSTLELNGIIMYLVLMLIFIILSGILFLFENENVPRPVQHGRTRSRSRRCPLPEF